MKAWKVDDPELENGSVIVFADTRSMAKQQALRTDQLWDAEFCRLRPRRAPKFDGREESPPTVRELVEEHGWATDCMGCGCRIDADADASDEDEDYPVRRPVEWLEHGSVRCADCAARADERDAERQRRLRERRS